MIRGCLQVGCQLHATVRIAWPGRGWVYYCWTHGRRAQGLLTYLGAASVYEESSLGWLGDAPGEPDHKQGCPARASPYNAGPGPGPCTCGGGQCSEGS